MNYNHPFWSAAQLVESLHAQTMKALLNRPSGAVVRVCSISVCTCSNKTFSDTVQGFCEDCPADHQCRRDCFCQSCTQAPSHKEAYAEQVCPKPPQLPPLQYRFVYHSGCNTLKSSSMRVLPRLYSAMRKSFASDPMVLGEFGVDGGRADTWQSTPSPQHKRVRA